jgi:hypothetical protein
MIQNLIYHHSPVKTPSDAEPASSSEHREPAFQTHTIFISSMALMQRISKMQQ